jgi:hypothetical protein
MYYFRIKAGDMLFIAAHAEVTNISGQEESAWGKGVSFLGSNWAMYFACEPPPVWSCVITGACGHLFPGIHEHFKKAVLNIASFTKSVD